MDKTKKKAIYGLIGSVVLLLIIIGTSYAYIKYDTEEQGVNVLGTDCISIDMKDLTDAITLQKAYPMTEDNEAIKPYTFTLTNNCSVGVDYQINLRIEDDGIQEDQKMPVEGNIATKVDEEDKVILSSENKVPKTETEEEDKYTIGSGTLEPKGTVQHSVRIWLDESAGNDTQNKIFKSKVVVEATQNQIVSNEPYKEELLQGTDPVLGDGLIAVEIDDKGTVTVADLTDKWYSYGEKRWANAIIPMEDAKSEVQRLIAGEIIKEDQIESYFVWIPKYSYKIQTTGTSSTGNEQAFDIKFGTDNTIDKEGEECPPITSQDAVEGTSGERGSCAVGEYMTHPAFLAFGDVKGLWVGKFETGREDGALTYSTRKEKYDSNDLSDILIKPNQYSWTYTNIATMHLLAINYREDLTSHMMKNTEWGAVAYLTQSIYGRCTKSDNDSITCEEVARNNNSNMVTGYAIVNPQETSSNYEKAIPGKDGSTGKTINYNNPKSVKASTTGNYTGIYDMSGGAYEYVMGVMYDSKNTAPACGAYVNHESGFNGQYTTTMQSVSGYGESKINGEDFPEARFYDVYKYRTIGPNAPDNRILGDATAETYKWYEDQVGFVGEENPWFCRGSNYSGSTTLDAGIFAAGTGTGEANIYTYRIVLAPL